MSNEKLDRDEADDFPQQFLAEVDELASKTADGNAWADLLYQKWFVCPTHKLADTLEISICRRSEYVRHGTDASNRLDVIVDSYNLGEASAAAGFELPHLSLRDLIAKSIAHIADLSSVDAALHDDDKQAAFRLLNDIEADVNAVLADLRSKLA